MTLKIFRSIIKACKWYQLICGAIDTAWAITALKITLLKIHLVRTVGLFTITLTIHRTTGANACWTLIETLARTEAEGAVGQFGSALAVQDVEVTKLVKSTVFIVAATVVPENTSYIYPKLSWLHIVCTSISNICNMISGNLNSGFKFGGFSWIFQRCLLFFMVFIQNPLKKFQGVEEKSNLKLFHVIPQNQQKHFFLNEYKLLPRKTRPQCSLSLGSFRKAIYKEKFKWYLVKIGLW